MKFPADITPNEHSHSLCSVPTRGNDFTGQCSKSSAPTTSRLTLKAGEELGDGMHFAQQILHRSARAISLPEFHDAILSTCKPRFPEARGVVARHVGLAISGGVDSMALAYLCSKLSQYDQNLKITDNPCRKFRAFVIDHKLREESTVEAFNVFKALRNLGIMTEVHPVIWKKELGDSSKIDDATNIESAARRARYRLLGRVVPVRKIATLLLAHHEDDQYETVLMRLITGHRNRGLRGMRKAASIPECEGQFGSFDSGWVDDQNSLHPFYNTRITKKERNYLKDELRSSFNQRMREHGDDYGDEASRLAYESSFGLGEMPVEDGGITIYRPLLEFSKDRLIATCLENNVPWFEDHTNRDPTLTLRNSVRHMHKSCELPVALQKPRILTLAKNWQRRAEVQDAEAKRLLQRMVLHSFEPHVGTLKVQFPEIPALISRRYTRTTQRYQRRISRMRLIAALAIQRVIALVSPDIQVPTISNLQNVISRLFPSLTEDFNRLGDPRPKAFNIAGLHFMPSELTSQSVTNLERSYPRTWYVSRQPYLTNAPLPQYRPVVWSFPQETHDNSQTSLSLRRQRSAWSSYRCSSFKWSQWLSWQFWDNRFWVRLKHRLPCRVLVLPFLPEHAKDFRESLSAADRDRLALILKKVAPGKVRYTLPAIYSEEYVDLEHVVARPGYPIPEDIYVPGVRLYEKGVKQPLPPIDTLKMRLLALPSLDLQLPGLPSWLLYKIRYKRADRETLRAMRSFRNSSLNLRRTGKLKKAKFGLGQIGRKAKIRKFTRKRRGELVDIQNSIQ